MTHPWSRTIASRERAAKGESGLVGGVGAAEKQQSSRSGFKAIADETTSKYSYFVSKK
jgi:hypothetical protein